jgi:hypothetical protein
LGERRAQLLGGGFRRVQEAHPGHGALRFFPTGHRPLANRQRAHSFFRRSGHGPLLEPRRLSRGRIHPHRHLPLLRSFGPLPPLLARGRPALRGRGGFLGPHLRRRRVLVGRQPLPLGALVPSGPLASAVHRLPFRPSGRGDRAVAEPLPIPGGRERPTARPAGVLGLCDREPGRRRPPGGLRDQRPAPGVPARFLRGVDVDPPGPFRGAHGGSHHRPGGAPPAARFLFEPGALSRTDGGNRARRPPRPGPARARRGLRDRRPARSLGPARRLRGFRWQRTRAGRRPGQISPRIGRLGARRPRPRLAFSRPILRPRLFGESPRLRGHGQPGVFVDGSRARAQDRRRNSRPGTDEGLPDPPPVRGGPRERLGPGRRGGGRAGIPAGGPAAVPPGLRTDGPDTGTAAPGPGRHERERTAGGAAAKRFHPGARAKNPPQSPRARDRPPGNAPGRDPPRPPRCPRPRPGP